MEQKDMVKVMDERELKGEGEGLKRKSQTTVSGVVPVRNDKYCGWWNPEDPKSKHTMETKCKARSDLVL